MINIADSKDEKQNNLQASRDWQERAILAHV